MLLMHAWGNPADNQGLVYRSDQLIMIASSGLGTWAVVAARCKIAKCLLKATKLIEMRSVYIC
jgi:hypothetical protein